MENYKEVKNVSNRSTMTENTMIKDVTIVKVSLQPHDIITPVIKLILKILEIGELERGVWSE